MKETYKFLTKNLPIILIGSIITTILGVIALYLGYNQATSWLSLKGACTIIFALVGFATMCYAGYIAFKTKDVHITKIKKSSGFLRVAAYLAFAMTIFMFGLDLIRLIIASYKEIDSIYFSAWRIIRFILALPLSFHFLFMALPAKFKRRRVVIPKSLIYITATSTVLWAVFSLLSAYFYNWLATMNILKIWQIIVYLVFAVFFLFEIKFEHIKPSPKGFVFTGCLAFIVPMAFSLTTVIGLSLRIIPTSKSFSAAELISSLIIGIYAFARVFAVPHTIKSVLDNRDSSTSSSKFDRNRHHHHDNVDAKASEMPENTLEDKKDSSES